MFRLYFVTVLAILAATNCLGKDVKLDCPSEGMDLKGASNWYTYYHNIPIWQICGNLCQDYLECEGWTWNAEEPNKGECNLWTYIGEPSEDSRKISGLRDCPFDDVDFQINNH